MPLVGNTPGTQPDSPDLASLFAVEFPPFPAVAWKVLEMTSDMYCGSLELTEVLSRDQALAGRVLKLANSAFFGRSARVSSISKALALVGNRRIRSLVVAASLEAIFKRTPFGPSLWAHSVGVGWCAAELARILEYAEPDEAYLAGLFHDLGKSALDMHYKDSFCQIVSLAQTNRKALIVTEREVLGFDHTEIGAALAEEWKLPSQFSNAVRFHHSPRLAPDFPYLCALVNFADGICLRQGIGPIADPELDLWELEASSILEVDSALVDEVGNGLAARLEADQALMRLA